MKWAERESWDKMLDLLAESHSFPSNSVQKTNKLLEALAYGIGLVALKLDKKK